MPPKGKGGGKRKTSYSGEKLSVKLRRRGQHGHGARIPAVVIQLRPLPVKFRARLITALSALNRA